jgi:hypothetical protein
MQIEKVPLSHLSKDHVYLIPLFTKIALVGSPLMNPAKNLRLNFKEKQTQSENYV